MKLREDDFSELAEHYTPRETAETTKHVEPAEVLPVLSNDILEVIKGMMASNPIRRMTVEEIIFVRPMRILADMKERSGSEGVRNVGAALVEEEAGFLELLLQA